MVLIIAKELINAEELINHFNNLYRLDGNDWEFKGWCYGCCGKKEFRKSSDIVDMGVFFEDEAKVNEESSFIEQNEYLKGLDVKRAEKIKEYLVKNGVSADRMEVVGKGKEALANEGTEEYQKAQNRMVDFVIK